MIDDSNFPNGVCKKCHNSVEVLIRKNNLQTGDIRYKCNICGYESIKKISQKIGRAHV